MNVEELRFTITLRLHLNRRHCLPYYVQLTAIASGLWFVYRLAGTVATGVILFEAHL